MFDSNGFLNFIEETEHSKEKNSEVYKILIVDDEPSVHEVTNLVLAPMSFQGKELELYHAYSAIEGEEILKEHPDMAVLLLDVVMETDNAGLDLVKIIRDDLDNSLLRIILRTGQPGHAPEEDVIVNYDINDYRNKLELTTSKLFSSMITALRSYSDLVKIQKNKVGLEKVLASTSSIIDMHSIDKFFAALLGQVLTLIHDETSNSCSSMLSIYISFHQDEKPIFNTGTGIFSDADTRQEKVREKYGERVFDALREQQHIKTDDYFIFYHKNNLGNEMLIIFDGKTCDIGIEDDLLNIFVKNIAITFDNLLMSNDIKESQKDTIFMLSELAEQRSHETGKHVKRVAYFAKEIAEELGLSELEVEEVFTTAPMHDIGKISISDTILKKPGLLSVDEFEVMKSHAKKGYDLLVNSEKRLMRVASVVALQHHEHFDGAGYPQGLQGDEIHIYARITGVCDVFDALSTQRIYKEAWPLEKVFDYIEKEKSKQFDPVIVQAFFARKEKILKLVEEHKD